MTISITGRQVDISEGFKDAAHQGIGNLFEKYQMPFIETQVILSKHAHNFHVDLNTHMNKNVNLRVSGEAADAYSSLQSAFDVLQKKIRKHKKRLSDHHRHHDVHHEELDYTILDGMHHDEPQEELAPTVIAEIKSSLPTLCVSDAVMRFDLCGDNAYIFRNAANKEINVLYRRKDGNIGWIDPKRQVQG